MNAFKTIKLLTFALGIPIQLMNAQGVTIGTNTPPDPSAVLDLQSTGQGFLFPRMTTVQRNGIANPAVGLHIFNLDIDCIEVFFANGGWKSIYCGCSAFPNATFSVPIANINNPASFSAPAPNMTYSWSFQNGSPATAATQTVQVTWSSPGKFGVTLTATDSAGCSTTHTDSVVVGTCQPISQTFTNCGATGRLGPSQGQCDATYGAGVVTVSGGIQDWVVPFTGTYRIEAAGARGGNGPGANNGGNGAVIRGDFSLTAGQVLRIVVGQMGITKPTDATTNYGGGGGGASYVWDNNSTTEPMIAAGGGGGGRESSSSASNLGGPGLTGSSGAGATSSGGSGGTGGNGGAGADNYAGAGGAGWKGNGGNTSNNQQQGGQMKFSFAGGENYYNSGTNYGVHGGFGGGGAAMHGGGGGGGYSGGGGGSNGSSAGGGGGSYNAGTNPVNQSGANNGHGYVTITRVCP